MTSSPYADSHADGAGGAKARLWFDCGSARQPSPCGPAQNYAIQRPASVCLILFLLVARQLAVSEAPGTILCKETLQNIVPPGDVLRNFVPFLNGSVSRCLACRGVRSHGRAPSGAPCAPRALTVPSRRHAGEAGRAAVTGQAPFPRRSLVWPMGPGTKSCKNREQVCANRREGWTEGTM